MANKVKNKDYAKFKKDLRTPGMQEGERKSLKWIADHRGISIEEAQKVALRRTAKNRSTAGMSSLRHGERKADPSKVKKPSDKPPKVATKPTEQTKKPEVKKPPLGPPAPPPGGGDTGTPPGNGLDRLRRLLPPPHQVKAPTGGTARVLVKTKPTGGVSTTMAAKPGTGKSQMGQGSTSPAKTAGISAGAGVWGQMAAPYAETKTTTATKNVSKPRRSPPEKRPSGGATSTKRS